MKKLALVRWRDAWFEFDRTGDTPERDDYPVETVGWVDEAQLNPTHTGRFLDVVSERLPEDDGERAVTHVPKESIIHPVILLTADARDPGDFDLIPEWFTQEY